MCERLPSVSERTEREKVFCGCKNLSTGNEKEILLQCSGRQESLISLQNESDEANSEIVIGKAIKEAQWEIYWAQNKKCWFIHICEKYT